MSPRATGGGLLTTPLMIVLINRTLSQQCRFWLAQAGGVEGMGTRGNCGAKAKEGRVVGGYMHDDVCHAQRSWTSHSCNSGTERDSPSLHVL